MPDEPQSVVHTSNNHGRSKITGVVPPIFRMWSWN